MKAVKLLKGTAEQSSLEGSMRKHTGGQKSQKSEGGQRNRKPVRKDVPLQCRIPPISGDCNSHEVPSPGVITKLPLDLNNGNERMLRPSKIKLQLFPLDEKIRAALEKDGHNPFLELTLSARKKISSILKHLCSKWGHSSIARGELMLFPFNVLEENLSSCRRWGSIEIGISAGDVYAFVGSPEIFRLRYGWVLSEPDNPTSCPLGHSQAEKVSHFNIEATSASENQAEMTSKEFEPSVMAEFKKFAVGQTVLYEPQKPVVQINQAEGRCEISGPSNSSEIKNDAADGENNSAEPVKYAETRADDNVSQTPLLFSDLSNISIGGLFSEASLQGLFNAQGIRSGSSRMTSQPVTDSLDAFIDQLKRPHSSTTQHPNMPSSILDAEDTCHSFAFTKPSSGRDFLSLGRSAFSELSNQDTAFRPFKCQKTEANVQNGSNGSSATAQESNTDPQPCSAGILNNENSLGLSSIRWNDSLGPFDLPLMRRQIINDDSISIGGFVR